MPKVRPATLDDIAELVRLRAALAVALAPDAAEPPPDGTGWRETCAAMLAEQLADDAARTVVIDGETGLAACGMGVIDRRLPTPYHPDGRTGYIFGIYTEPVYRRRGYARAITEELLRWFDERGLRRVNLITTPAGLPLYRSLGFRDHPDRFLTRTR